MAVQQPTAFQQNRPRQPSPPPPPGWRASLRRASFRGVAFYTPSISNPVGRKTAVHSYPQRDLPLVEDLGGLDPTFTLEAFVLGEDYLTQAKALEAALNMAGSGVLVHPTRGELTVAVVQPTTRKDDFEREGRLARFTLTFMQVAAGALPTVETDTRGSVITQVGFLSAQAASDFGGEWSASNAPYVAAQGIADVTDALDVLATIQSGIDAAGLIINGIDQLAGTLIAIVNNPALLLGSLISTALGDVAGLVESALDLADSIQGIIQAFEGLFGSGCSLGSFGMVQGLSGTPREIALSSATPMRLIADVVAATAPSIPFQPLPVTTSVPAVAQMTVNRSALLTLIRRTALAVMAQEAVTATYTDSTQPLAIRDDLGARLDTEILMTGNSVQTIQALSLLRAALVIDLTNRAAALPDLTTVQVATPMPALVLASQLYDDPTRADEIAQLNGAENAGFVGPGSLTVLSS